MITAYNKRTKQLTQVEHSHLLRPMSEWVVNPLIEDYDALIAAPNDLWGYNEETSELRILTAEELNTLPDRVEIARKIKQGQLNNDCAKSIMAGFKSSATGTEFWYDFGYEDQQNIMASIFFSQPTPERPRGTPTLYAVKTQQNGEKFFVSHTYDQMNKVATDATLHKVNQLQHLSFLLHSLSLVNTVDEINSIDW